MASKWKNVWERKGASSSLDALREGDVHQLFVELKKLDGFDVVAEGLSLAALLSQYKQTMEMLSARTKIRSVYEVGCGCGANLLLMEHDGIECGGIDYSSSLVGIAKTVLKSDDIICAEASQTPVEKKL